jgi:hypothetical protein
MASTSQLPVPSFFLAGSSEVSLSGVRASGTSRRPPAGPGLTSFMSSVGRAAPESCWPTFTLMVARSFFASAIESPAGAGGSPAQAAAASIAISRAPDARIGFVRAGA